MRSSQVYAPSGEFVEEILKVEEIVLQVLKLKTI